jgi:hypothetical protein
LVPVERIELPTNGLQNRCSATELTRQINGLVAQGGRIATGLPPLFAGIRSHSVSRLRKSRFHNLSGAGVGVSKQVAIDLQRDGGRGMPYAPADGRHVHAGCDQMRNMGVAQGVRGAVDLQGIHRHGAERPHGSRSYSERRQQVRQLTLGQPARLLIVMCCSSNSHSSPRPSRPVSI